jgi:hypothetical protein
MPDPIPQPPEPFRLPPSSPEPRLDTGHLASRRQGKITKRSLKQNWETHQ